MHMHMQTTPLYGNQTGLEYYYATVFFGSQRQPQALIVDTGSAVAAIPCAELCTSGSCGRHINPLFKAKESQSHFVYNCKVNTCVCSEEDRCRFYQGYQEGSSYDGYIVADELYFGENTHPGLDGFTYTFGCVKQETHFFYTQDADGILGMSMSTPYGNSNKFVPIYKVMYDDGLIEKLMFTLCLGKNGGYFQMGGFDGTGFLETEPAWVQINDRNADFIINLKGISMNNHFIKGSDSNFKMMIDSGTTFTYFPRQLFNLLETHFRWFCGMDPENNCKGALRFDNPGYLCWHYDEKLFPNGPIDFYKSLPILRFAFDAVRDKGDKFRYSYDWYPSEYLYKENDQQYCVAADINSSNQIMFGGTLMRQHAVIIDVGQNRVGFAHSTCAFDPNQISDEQTLLDAGQKTALDSTSLLSKEDEKCDHNKVIDAGNWWKPSRITNGSTVSNQIESSPSAPVEAELPVQAELLPSEDHQIVQSGDQQIVTSEDQKIVISEDQLIAASGDQQIVPSEDQLIVLSGDQPIDLVLAQSSAEAA